MFAASQWKGTCVSAGGMADSCGIQPLGPSIRQASKSSESIYLFFAHPIRRRAGSSRSSIPIRRRRTSLQPAPPPALRTPRLKPPDKAASGRVIRYFSRSDESQRSQYRSEEHTSELQSRENLV